jgi:endonuclease III
MPNTKLARILDVLERIYGSQRAAGPSDPYEMIVYLNCGYPATDTSCAKGFEALKREVGTSPERILKTSKTKLSKLMRLGGIVPELRAERLKEIARKVKIEFSLDLATVVKQRLPKRTTQNEKGLRNAKKMLQEFPTIGEPSAEKILLFAGLAPVAAVPSACLSVPIRLFVGNHGKNYAADYRRAREILTTGLPNRFMDRQRGYLLLKRHGQEVCKRSTPRCEICPVTGECAYWQERALDQKASGAESWHGE